MERIEPIVLTEAESSFSTSRGAIPAEDLPGDAAELLLLAMRSVSLEFATGAASQAELVERSRRAASAASAEAMRSQRSLTALDRLASTSADTAAAASLQAGDRFPAVVSAEGFMGVPNLLVALGRRYAVLGDPETAVDRYFLALDMMERFHVYTGVSSIGGSVYWVVSRTAEVVADLAARRGMQLEEMLAGVDDRLFKKYAHFFRGSDYSGPRAFAALAMLRSALLNERVSGRQYLSSLREELVHLRDPLKPDSIEAAESFDTQLESLLEQISVRLGERTSRLTLDSLFPVERRRGDN